MVITGAGPGDHGGGHRGRGRGQLVRREHPAAVRGRDDAVPRRRSEARQLPLLLHAQGHVREGGARVRAAARRVRHARRGVRAADARADGQGAARADRAARRARRHVLVELDAVRRARAARPRLHLARRHEPRDDHRRRRRSRSTRSRASTATTTRCDSSTATSCCACSSCPDPTSLDQLNDGVRRHRSRAARSSPPRRARPRSPTTTSPTWPGCDALRPPLVLAAARADQPLNDVGRRERIDAPQRS